MAARRPDGMKNWRSSRAVTAGLVAATVLTTALTIWLALGLHAQREADERRQDILTAARQSALNFTSSTTGTTTATARTYWRARRATSRSSSRHRRSN